MARRDLLGAELLSTVQLSRERALALVCHPAAWLLVRCWHCGNARQASQILVASLPRPGFQTCVDRPSSLVSLLQYALSGSAPSFECSCCKRIDELAAKHTFSPG